MVGDVGEGNGKERGRKKDWKGEISGKFSFVGLLENKYLSLIKID